MGMDAPLPDRIKTPQVARAIMSPSGLLLAGAGMSAAILGGLPIVAAAVIGAGVWAVRVAAAIPKRDKKGPSRRELSNLGDPWRRYVQDARIAQAQFATAVKQTKPGPLQDRLASVSRRIDDGVNECWNIAVRGQSLDMARMTLDVPRINQELAECATYPPSPSVDATRHALQSQLETAHRLETVATDAQTRLRLLNAQLDEAVAQAVELSVHGTDTSDLQSLAGSVDTVVGDLEALRQGLEEAGGGTATLGVT